MKDGILTFILEYKFVLIYAVITLVLYCVAAYSFGKIDIDRKKDFPADAACYCTLWVWPLALPFIPIVALVSFFQWLGSRKK